VLPFFGPTHELAASGRSPFTLIHPFEWRTQCEAAVARDALYPLRPDSCVAFADVGGTRAQSTATLSRAVSGLTRKTGRRRSFLFVHFTPRRSMGVRAAGTSIFAAHTHRRAFASPRPAPRSPRLLPGKRHRIPRGAAMSQEKLGYFAIASEPNAVLG
jgi:hypothetical protein